MFTFELSFKAGDELISFDEDVEVAGGFLSRSGEGVGEGELGGDEHLEEVVAGKTGVLVLREMFLLARHAFEETKEIRLGVHTRVDTFVPKFLEEAGIPIVDCFLDDTQVSNGIVRDVPVDMVIDLAFAQFAQEGATDESMAIGTIVNHVRIDRTASAVVAYSLGFAEGMFELLSALVVEFSVRSGEQGFAFNFIGWDLFNNRNI